MKEMTYYVVEISFRSSNPIHRAICFHQFNDNIQLFGPYNELIQANVRQLSYFNVVEEITSMGES